MLMLPWARSYEIVRTCSHTPPFILPTECEQTPDTHAQELGVQIEEPFSIIALESIFDATQARARMV